MAKESCSCSGVFLTSLLAFGVVGGGIAYFGYKFIKQEIDKQNKQQ